MAISELQIALIGAGAAAVALVWGYNVWQDRQHRKAADRIFKGNQGDALLADDAAPVADSNQRLEPRLAPETEAGDPAADQAPANDESGALAPADPLATTEPAMPSDCADEIADCVLRFTAAEPVPAPAVQAMQRTWAGELSKPLRWLAKGDGDEPWRRIEADDSGRYRNWAAALQLVDRRGPVSDGELGRFFDGVQSVAQQAGATMELPSRGELVMRAGALDQFCAGVDIQFVLHVVEASGGVFVGTKLRGVAEAAGLALEGDGVFRARDEVGGEMFTVANLGAERLEADSIKSLATHGLTLSLDVPRVTDGRLAFDRMLATARQLAGALGGVLVDAQRAPLADAMIDAIRAKTGELQARMNEAGIVPGSVRALRLFS
jgi:FtsZ-interacting cell division protein ZipA